MNLGIDELLRNEDLRKPLRGKRCALLGHPASVTRECVHTLDALMDCPEVKVVSAFGPHRD